MFNHLGRIILTGILMEALWLLSYCLVPLREHSHLFVMLMLALFGLFLWSFFCCPLKDRRVVTCMLGFALLFRLTLIPADPGESEDVYRYLWDARLASAGVDPYKYPPEAPELAKFREQRIYPMINSKSYVTAYPPLSQALFRISYELFGVEVTPMKAIFSLLEFSCVLLSWRLLILFGSALQPLLLIAWNPFFIFEFSHSGHSDSSMMLLLLLSVYLLQRSRNVCAMASLGGAFLAKLHPVLWLPLFLRRVGWKAGLGFLGVAGTGMFAYLSPETWTGYLQSLRLYFRLFEFNASIHYLLRAVGKQAYNAPWDKLTGPYLAALLLVIVVLIAWKFPLRNARDVLHAGFWIMTADLCLATTVHPWYISWAALALPFFPYAFMVFWTGACFLSYLAYSYHPVYEPAWVSLAEYLPMYALMGWEILRGGPLFAPLVERKGAKAPGHSDR